MNSLRLAAFVAATFLTNSAFAAPSGNWSCTLAGAEIGDLTISEQTYSFTGTETQKGAPGAFEFLNEPGMLRVTSGPLMDDLGMSLGFFSPTVTPAFLVFNAGPGKGMSCNPV